MSNQAPAPQSLGQLASGTSRCWSLAVDETIENGKYSLEIDSPAIYLTFDLLDIDVLPKAQRFLTNKGEPELCLGQFLSSPVTLVHDNEDFPRVFLVVGTPGGAVLRVTLLEDDMRMFREALAQVLSEVGSIQATPSSK